MPKSSFNRRFDNWYKRNRKRFKYHVQLIKKHKKYMELRFSGVTPRLICSIKDYGCHYGNATIWIMRHKTIWDSLVAFGPAEMRTSSGQYYCYLCEPEDQELFPTRQDLWEKHCFEPLFEWIKTNLDKSRWVGLFGDEDGRGSTWAELMDKNEVEGMRNKKDFVEAFPLVPMRPQGLSGQ